MLFVTVLALIAAIPALGSRPAAADPEPPVISAPDTPLPAGTYCNQTPTQPGLDPSSYNGPTKVLHIFEENESSSIVNADTDNDADFELNTLAGQCGVLSNAHNETHGSETNYLDAADGGNNPQWTLCDHAPNRPAGSCPYGASSQISAPNIFGQVESKYGAAGWRVYGQSQTANCQMSDSADQLFVVRHNAPQFFTGTNCAANDIPAGAWQSQQGQFYQDVMAGNLPAFGIYTPNDTDDGHDPATYDQPSINVSNLDDALANVMALIQSGPDYQTGRLIVMVTFDEGTTTGRAPYSDARVGEDCADPSQGETQPSCQILTYVAGRYVPWSNDGDFTTHYSMLKTTQQILGLTPQNGYNWLGHAGDMLTNDFYNAFNLAPDSWSNGTSQPPAPPTIPSAPTAVSASAGDATATVSFTPPASSGGSAISSYTVTSSPGAITGTGHTTPIVLTGLSNAVSYTFTVTATNGFGAGPPSAGSNPVVPMGAGSGPELLPDPGFEAGNGGWIAFKIGTLSRVATPVHGGSHALQVTSPQGSVSLVGLTQNTVVSNSVAGQTYTSSCYVRATTANLNVQIRMLEYTQNYSSDTQIAQTVVASLPVNTWTLVRVSGTAASSAHRVIPQIYSTKQTSANGNLIYDDCSMRAGVPASVTPPGAPTGVSATAGDAAATVAFTAPASNGGGAITGYTVTSTPGGVTATGSTSPLTVNGLTNGTSYTFTAVATNSAGNGPASATSNSVTPSAVPTVPPAPSGLIATAGDGQVGLAWTAPGNDGGSAITDYVVAYSLAGLHDWTFVDEGSVATAATVLGLTNGTSYDFEVSAVNAVGQGAFSAAATKTPAAAPPPATVPDPPTGAQATAGDGSANVSFVAPADDGGSTITKYTVTSNPGAVSVDGLASPVTVNGLTNGVSYTFTVTATNNVGTSSPSVASNSVTPLATATAPGVPTALAATPGNAQVALAWTAPADNGGSALTDYQIQYRVHGANTWLLFNDGTSTATAAGVTGLANGTNYDFQVSAVNGVATGNASSTVAATPRTVPGAPTGVTATARNASAVVSFAPPASNGGAAITTFTVTSTPGNVTATGTAAPITVTGLTNGVSYTFTVTATNPAGTGAVSLPSASVRPAAELLPDAGFESGNGGWIAFKIGTLTRVTTPVRGGSHALMVASPQSTVSLVGLTQNSVVTNTTLNKTYTASCYVQPTAANLNVLIRLLEYTSNFGSDVSVGTTTVAKLTVGVWTLVQVSGVARNSGERMVPQIYSTNETSTNGRLVYDDCSVG